MDIIKPNNISLLIAKYRKQKGFSQEKLAKIVSVTPNYISLLENGRRNPSTELLIKMTKVLDINVIIVPKKQLDFLQELQLLNEKFDLINILKNLCKKP